MLEIKAQADGTIEGYASCFSGPADAVGDVVAPGAFAESLRTNPHPIMLREHTGDPVGSWTAAETDTIGLRVRGRVTDPSTLADLRAGRLDGLSIGYVATKSHQDAAGHRVLDAVNLQEISIVKRPASSRARVLSVKSCPNPKPPKGKAMALDTTTTADNCDPADDTATDARITAVETAVSDLSTRVSSIETSLKTQTKSLDQISTTLRRPGVAPAPAADAGEIEVKSFTSFVRRGVERMEHAETKSLRVSDDTQGGFLAPSQFVAELLKNVVLYSPIRSVARVMTVGSSNIILPKRTSTLIASWVGEVADRSSTSPAYGQNAYQVSELAAYTDVSNALLEDSAFNVASELASDFAEQFGKSEGTAMVNGNGVLKPLGFMNHPDLLSTNSGSASTITAEGLIQLFHDLAPAYRNNATWVLNSGTLGTIRKLKDGSTGTFLLLTSGIGNSPSTTLLGRPVLECPDMPDIAGSAYPVVFGDFSQGFRIFDRLSLSVLRDPYSVATNGLTRFHARRRLAAGVAKAEAIRKLKISA